MKIRPVSPTDRAEWLRLLLGLHPESAGADHLPAIDAFFSKSSIDELIPSAVFVAERHDGRLGGMLELSIRNYAEGSRGDTPYVESWYVDEDLRGTGIGRSLMEAGEQWARGRGFAVLASDAMLENTLSHAAHRAVGFEIVERIVVFRKNLSTRPASDDDR